ncbi:peroxiredoxin-like family protein [Cohnella herbarum]|uniref:AhpC/TSA family protein n=1 Tax=Cohnella herbarum TaxID=2728023 RepID=A0A7Z2ZLH3_9BACL|nr:peroxiredoxin-like family protein [Cohnella herbarum]QJD83855.1 AhpC/TSA family protein [Cohnella herbarum]
MTQKLLPGDSAPLFRATDSLGNPVSLDPYKGRKLLIAFFRFSACGLCNLRVHRFSERYPEWQRHGLAVIAIFESPVENVIAHVGQQNAPFPIIADPRGEIYDRYGVEISEAKAQATLSDPRTKTVIAEIEAAGFKLTHEEGSNFNRMPAEFLIDESGIVRVAHYNQLITDDMPFESIDRFVANQR